MKETVAGAVRVLGYKMNYGFIKYVTLQEDSHKELELKRLPYTRDDLAPVMSESTLNYHYGKLAKAYVDRYNKGEGDPVFNKAGAFLHNIYFAQFCKLEDFKDPTGPIKEFILKHFTDGLKELKEEFEKVAMGIQGSGWVYLSKRGKIKTITNHAIKDDILLLIDWWEHAWALDYQADKKKYLENQWKIINWEHLNVLLKTGD
jgi:Fe-Mn family superoxide dismutase